MGNQTLQLSDSRMELRWRRAGDRPVASASSLRPGDTGSDQEKAAYERGWRDAEKSLREQMVMQRNDLVQLQQGALKSLHDAVGEVVRQSETLLVELALEVAQKLVHGMPIDAAMVAAAVRSALAQAEPTATVTVQLNPEDHVLFQSLSEAERSEVSGGRVVRCIPTSHVARGGCVVQTHFGILDCQRETVMRTVKEALV